MSRCLKYSLIETLEHVHCKINFNFFMRSAQTWLLHYQVLRIWSCLVSKSPRESAQKWTGWVEKLQVNNQIKAGVHTIISSLIEQVYSKHMGVARKILTQGQG